MWGAGTSHAPQEPTGASEKSLDVQPYQHTSTQSKMQTLIDGDL